MSTTSQTPVIDDAVPAPDVDQQKSAKPAPKRRKVDELYAKLPGEFTKDNVNTGYLQQRERDGCASELALVRLVDSDAVRAVGPHGMPWSINGRVFVLRAEQWYLLPRYVVDNIRDHRDYSPVVEATKGSIRRIGSGVTASRVFTCDAITL